MRAIGTFNGVADLCLVIGSVAPWIVSAKPGQLRPAEGAYRCDGIEVDDSLVACGPKSPGRALAGPFVPVTS